MADKLDPIERRADDTGPGIGSSPEGVPAGGGALGGTLEPATPTGKFHKTPATADTGLDFGPGQATTTGTLPTQGGDNLDGTGEGETVGTDTPGGDEPPHGRSSDDVSDHRSEADQRYRHDGVDESSLDS